MDGTIPDQYQLNLSSTVYSIVSKGYPPAYFDPLVNFWLLYPISHGWYLDTDLGNFFNNSQLVNPTYGVTYEGNIGNTPMGALFICLTIFAALVVFAGIILASFGKAITNNCAPVDNEEDKKLLVE